MTTTLKILQLTNRIPYPLNDGGNIATYYVTKYLNQFGHEMTMACLNTVKHRQDPTVLSSIAKVYTTEIDTSITRIGILKSFFQKTPYNISRFDSSEFEGVILKAINENQPDIIQLEGIYLTTYTKTIRAASKAPIILRSHNIEHEIWERTAKNESNPLKRWYLQFLYKKIKRFELENMHLVDGIIAITDRDYKFYKNNHFKGKLITAPAGTDYTDTSTEIISAKLTSSSFLGSMEWIPNVQGVEWYLEKIWPTLKQKLPELTFHVAGKNMSIEMKNRKTEGVTFYGTVDNAKDFLLKHPIMIVPLLSGGGMRLKIIEAMALGRCVVSTSIGAEGIEAEHLKEIILADTPEQFIQSITQLSINPSEVALIGKNAQKLAIQKYSWEKLVREIEKFYIEFK